MKTYKSCKRRNIKPGSVTIKINFYSENIDLLSSFRNDWTREYATGLERRIDEALDRYLDIDKWKDLREATSYLVSIALPARRDLTFFKTQVEVDFKDEADHILASLGFPNYYLLARKRNSQEGLIANLVSFASGAYEFDPILREQFNFSKVIRNMASAGKKEGSPTT